LRTAVEYALSKKSVIYRKTKAPEFFLEQAADMLCTLELTACKYHGREQTSTDEKFFGSAGSFKNNFMKSIKRKRL